MMLSEHYAGKTLAVGRRVVGLTGGHARSVGMTAGQ